MVAYLTTTILESHICLSNVSHFEGRHLLWSQLISASEIFVIGVHTEFAYFYY